MKSSTKDSPRLSLLHLNADPNNFQRQDGDGDGDCDGDDSFLSFLKINHLFFPTILFKFLLLSSSLLSLNALFFLFSALGVWRDREKKEVVIEEG